MCILISYNICEIISNIYTNTSISPTVCIYAKTTYIITNMPRRIHLIDTMPDAGNIGMTRQIHLLTLGA